MAVSEVMVSGDDSIAVKAVGSGEPSAAVTADCSEEARSRRRAAPVLRRRRTQSIVPYMWVGGATEAAAQDLEVAVGPVNTRSREVSSHTIHSRLVTLLSSHTIRRARGLAWFPREEARRRLAWRTRGDDRPTDCRGPRRETKEQMLAKRGETPT